MKNLKQLLGICEHKWKLLGVQNIYSEDVRNIKEDLPIRTEHILQCEKCGEIKRKGF